MLRWSQRVIDLAEGDPAKRATFIFGSPLARAFAPARIARYPALGRPGWRDDSEQHGVAIRPAVPTPVLRHGNRLICRCNRSHPDGVLRPVDTAVREIEGCPARSPNDPPMISPWPSPGQRWAWRYAPPTAAES